SQSHVLGAQCSSSLVFSSRGRHTSFKCDWISDGALPISTSVAPVTRSASCCCSTGGPQRRRPTSRERSRSCGRTRRPEAGPQEPPPPEHTAPQQPETRSDHPFDGRSP